MKGKQEKLKCVNKIKLCNNDNNSEDAAIQKHFGCILMTNTLRRKYCEF